MAISPRIAFWASRAVFWSLPGYNQRKLTTKPFARRALRGLLIQMQNICFWSSGMRRRQNLVFSPSLFLHFSFPGHLVGFILVRKDSWKAFTTLGFDERKGRWVMEQDSHGNFRVSVIFCSFLRPPILNRAHSGMVSGISSPFIGINLPVFQYPVQNDYQVLL